jgi:hypothetical protein
MGRLRSIHERSSRCNLFTAPASPVKVAQPAHSVCCCVPGWAPQVRATTVGRARSASRFTVAPLNFRRKAASISVQSRLPGGSRCFGPRSADRLSLESVPLSSDGNRAQGVHSARAIRVAGRQGRAIISGPHGNARAVCPDQGAVVSRTTRRIIELPRRQIFCPETVRYVATECSA